MIKGTLSPLLFTHKRLLLMRVKQQKQQTQSSKILMNVDSFINLRFVYRKNYISNDCPVNLVVFVSVSNIPYVCLNEKQPMKSVEKPLNNQVDSFVSLLILRVLSLDSYTIPPITHLKNKRND